MERVLDMNISRKLGVIAAAGALSVGLVACADEEGDMGAATTVAETATETNTMTETQEPAEATTAGTEVADGVPVATADGTQAMVPAGLAEAMDKFTAPEYGGDDWGEPMSIDETEQGWVAAYADGHYITWNENTGGAPIWGKIGETWADENWGEGSVGFPTAAETPIPGEMGWTQEFENGTISWALDEATGEFGPVIEAN